MGPRPWPDYRTSFKACVRSTGAVSHGYIHYYILFLLSLSFAPSSVSQRCCGKKDTAFNCFIIKLMSGFAALA